MLRQGGGVIVNMASVSGHIALATIAPYTTSKHGTMGLSKIAAIEYAPRNIRINSISPGAVDTPMLARGLQIFGVTPEQAARDYPIKRIVTPYEIARSVMFLASDDATEIVGMDLDVTGGYLAG
ncbi:hypothetical protein DAETH_37990 (plasmid) [Deinococcus aetherius]|uniref:Uncharacterized protein n=1 Tax=Deinococcus aetherius TaxID=200252 RepID=A0ABM8AJF3_9DEIO|nr:hypothetical protein DAETH_37990 [Deinococcus aetherius]